MIISATFYSLALAALLHCCGGNVRALIKVGMLLGACPSSRQACLLAAHGGAAASKQLQLASYNNGNKCGNGV